MEGVHSYEQRSVSDHDETNFHRNRIIVADRRDQKVYNPAKSSEFQSNEWRTSKYTIFSFLPKNLFEQFRRLANFYFLTTAILQLVIPFSPVGPVTSVLPLLFVISTTACKQAYEDYLRHKIDKEVNNRLCHVLRDKKLIKTRSKDIKVGDIVYVRNNEEVPCDLILLATSGSGDRCYVTTANLDGETSLKGRSCFHIKEKLGSINEIDQKLLLVECEKPNATLYEFNGYIRAPISNKSLNKFLSKVDPSGVKLDSSIAYSIFKQSKKSSLSSTRSKLGSEKQDQANKLILSYLNTETYHDIPLDISNLLLRASRLKNTQYIYGLAIYTGRDTKLAHNSHVKANKFSSIEGRVNLFLFIAFVILATFTLVASFRYQKPDPSYWFFDKLNKSDSFEKILVAHFLLYNYLIPISLYVTLEFVKFFGTISVIDDKRMRVEVWKSINAAKSSEDLASNGKLSSPGNANQQLSSYKVQSQTSVKSTKKVRTIEGPKCNSSDLNEELGQVEVIFSDKTGTLTENRMKFTACSTQGQMYRSIMGQLYLQPANLFNLNIPNIAKKLSTISHHRYAKVGFTISADSKRKITIPENSASKKGPNNSTSSRSFDHQKVPPLERLKSIDSLDRQEDLAKFFTCLCLCSTITLNETLPIKDCLPDKTSFEYNFQAASPDEESLITAAQSFGLIMCKSNEQECFIAIVRSKQRKVRDGTIKSGAKGQSGKFKALVETKNSTDKYIIRHFIRLIVLEFTSARKRMSVLYRDCDNNCIIMVSKGSEEMLDCIDMNNMDINYENCINSTMAHFDAFAKSGLRTLLIAWRQVSESEFVKIDDEMKEAKLSIQDRDYLTSKLYHRIESNMRLIGTTAVEDTLQEGVPETIENLRSADIKVWLLTGDKVETAISVAYLCKLLDNEMVIFRLVRQQDVQACNKLLEYYLAELERIEKEGNGQVKYALVADGRSFHYAMKYAKKEFSKLSKQCCCVLGCRLSPLQKAEVVEMVKNNHEKPITLAIGDGANDVSMIQEAHVGIGIFGKEGRQAVNSSDFAIGRFNLLNRLLFVHGHLFYHRTSNTIHYFFYKNFVFILPQFLYSFYNLSSATTLYHPILLITYNLMFTSLPILLYGLFEIHIPEKVLESYPKLYKINRNSGQLQLRAFLSWLIIGALQALIGFYLLYFNWGSHTPFLESGKMAGLSSFSLILYFAIVITATIKLYLVSKSHSIYFISCALASCLFLPLFFYGYSLIDVSRFISDNSLYGQLAVLLSSPMFWIAVMTTSFATILPDIIWFIRCKTSYFKQINSIINESK